MRALIAPGILANFPVEKQPKIPHWMDVLGGVLYFNRTGVVDFSARYQTEPEWQQCLLPRMLLSLIRHPFHHARSEYAAGIVNAMA